MKVKLFEGTFRGFDSSLIGTYGATPGPTYETHQEVISYTQLGTFARINNSQGANAFGMSTIPETMTAAAVGIEVYAMSLITNLATGLTDEKLSHHAVENDSFLNLC